MSNLFYEFITGGEEAFNTYCERFYNNVYKSLRRFGCDEHLAKDLTQDVFKDVWDCRAEFNNEEHLRNTLFKKAKACFFAHQRRGKIARKAGDELSHARSEADTDIELTMVKEEVSAALRATVVKLPAQQKIVVDHLLQGKSVGVIAQELRLAPQTVRNHKTHAIHFLRAELLRRDLTLAVLAVILLIFYYHL